ncbi:MAG: hypothetical protein IIA67_11520 [Planctomycetes bacterium]|nr:hypothetical protein [Planctomycetota bacterium]
MKTYKIALYPGDGIGPEVMAEALRVLESVQQIDGAFLLETTTLPWGAALWRQTGQVVPDDFLDILRPSDAILLGAVGWPAEIPDHLTLAPLVRHHRTTRLPVGGVHRPAPAPFRVPAAVPEVGVVVEDVPRFEAHLDAGADFALHAGPGGGDLLGGGRAQVGTRHDVEVGVGGGGVACGPGDAVGQTVGGDGEGGRGVGNDADPRVGGACAGRDLEEVAGPLVGDPGLRGVGEGGGVGGRGGAGPGRLDGVVEAIVV